MNGSTERPARRGPRPPRVGCADRSEARGEFAAGTLGDFDVGLFVEARRPMPRLAVADIHAPFARRVLDWWAEFRATGRGVHPRVLAVRDPRRPAAGADDVALRVFALLPRADGVPLQFSWTLPAPEALMDLDIPALVVDPQRSFDALDARRRVVVCTHGKVDPCCAVRGHALWRALSDLPDVDVWQGSHFGGCRFAGNLWCLPSGNCYGHVAPESAAAVVADDGRGRIGSDGWRGRLGQTPVAAAAEALLRRRTGSWFQAAVRVRTVRAVDEDWWDVRAEIDGSFSVWRLVRRAGPAADRLLCRAETPTVLVDWELDRLS